MASHRIIVLAAIAAAASSLCAQEQTVRIGVATPLTGPIAHLGRDMEYGARLAVDELNAENLMIGGQRVKLQLVVEDDQADPAVATAVANRLVDARVAAVVGHLNSGTTIPAARVYDNAGIPQVAPAATNPQYTQLGYKYAARLMATDIQQGSGIANFAVKSLAAKTAAVVDDRTAYGKGLADQVATDLAKAGVKVVRREYTTDKATDFTAILTGIKSASPDVVVYAGADAQAGPMNRQMKQLGINAKFISGDGVCTGAWSKLAAGANEGHYCTQAGAPRSGMTQFTDFEKRFKAKFNTDIVVFAPYGYDAVLVLVDAMRRANSTDPKLFAPQLTRTEAEGVTGTVRFDSRGDNLNGVVSVYQVRDGKLEIAK